MNTASMRWYELDRYRIFAKPLELNPYWTTHHIYLDGVCIGRQLSVPSVSDCDWHESRGRHQNLYRTNRYEVTQDTHHHRKAGPGRPRKDAPKPPRFDPALEIPELA